jgi:aromatic ring-opening dioxygenase LigB subunit
LSARSESGREEIGRRVRRADPDTIVVATPHNLRLDGGFTAVVTSERVIGTLAAGGRAPAVIEASFPCDRDLAGDILGRAGDAGVPVVGVNWGALAGPVSVVAMDWGALIPLYFLGRRTGEGRRLAPGPVRVDVGPWDGDGAGSGSGAEGGLARPRVVIIGPSRDGPRQSLVRLGEIIAETAEASGRRVAFVASADHGHAHLAEGPFGYDPASAVYDDLIRALVRENRLEDLLTVAPALVEAGKPDSLWQMLILLGVPRMTPLRGEFLTYEVPTYFGMLCASYEPQELPARPSGWTSRCR